MLEASSLTARLHAVTAICSRFMGARASILQISWPGAHACLDWHRSRAGEIEASAMSAWFHAVTAIRNEIMGWTLRQSKHATVGWPLATLLTCLQDDARFLANNDQLIEALLTRLKVSFETCESVMFEARGLWCGIARRVLTCLQDDARFLADTDQLREALLARLKVRPGLESVWVRGFR